MEHALVSNVAAESAELPLGGMFIYNTLMALAAGVALVLIVKLGRKLYRKQEVVFEGWAIAFAVLGFILTLTGAHMTLTWPLNPNQPHANIVFGETTLAFGVLLLGAAFVLWRLGKRNEHSLEPVTVTDEDVNRLRTLAKPVSWFVASLGLALIAIAIAGVRYKLYTAPAEEPISGEFHDYPYVEAIFISSLFALMGIGALLAPFALRSTASVLLQIIGVCWVVAGVVWVLFGAMNYFTHIGLIVNLSP